MGHGIITRRGIDTSSATATSNKIISPYTAFVNGVKLTGDVVDYSGGAVAGTPYNVDGSGNFGVRIPNSGVYSQNEVIYASAASVGLNADKIISGQSILGVNGTVSIKVNGAAITECVAPYVSTGRAVCDLRGNVLTVIYKEGATDRATITIQLS